MAICRLKRVAADHRDDVTGLLPKMPQLKNGKRIACIGAGRASLTVANDLVPLGYEVDDLRAVRRARRPDAHQYSRRSACRSRCWTRRSA